MELKILTVLCCFGAIWSSEDNSFKIANDRYAGRIVHIESLRKTNYWLRSYKSKYLDYKKQVDEDQIYFAAWSQFQIRASDEKDYVTIESMRFKNHFAEPEKRKGYIKLSYVRNPEHKVAFKWKIECTDRKCRIQSKKFGTYLYHRYNNWAKMYTYGQKYSNMRILAPHPHDSYKVVLSTKNYAQTPVEKTIEIKEGVSYTKSQSRTIGFSLSAEIGEAFKLGFGAKLSASWTKSSSRTFQKSTTIKYKVVIPPHTQIVVKQLQGSYGPFQIGSREFKVERHALGDSGGLSLAEDSVIETRPMEINDEYDVELKPVKNDESAVEDDKFAFKNEKFDDDMVY